MLTAALDERNKLRTEVDELQAKASKYWLERHNMQTKVYEFFRDRYEAGDDEITCDKEDVNERLESIGTEKLKSLFTVKGTITFVLTDVEADSEEEAERIAESEVTMSFDGDGDLSDWDVEISDTTQQ
jgi:hypothetical protein